jgi:hypothetical protein
MAETIISVYRMSSDFLACIGGVLYESLEGRLGMLRSLGDTWFMAFRKE